MPLYGSGAQYGDGSIYGSVATAAPPGGGNPSVSLLVFKTIYTQLLDTRDLSLGKIEPFITIGEGGFLFRMNSGFALEPGDTLTEAEFLFIKPDGSNGTSPLVGFVPGTEDKFQVLVPDDQFFDQVGRWQVQLKAVISSTVTKTLFSRVESFSVGPSLFDED